MKVIVNCAMTADGKLATKDRKQLAISSEEDLLRVHSLRASVDAILVGVGTVLADDPKLTVKSDCFPNSINPIRVVLDSRLRTPAGSRVLNDDAETIIYTLAQGKFEGAEVVHFEGRGLVSVELVVEDLEKRGVQALLVEGGGETIWSFFEAGLVDEYSVFVGGQIVGGRTAPTPVDGEGRSMGQGSIDLELASFKKLGDGVLLKYRVRK